MSGKGERDDVLALVYFRGNGDVVDASRPQTAVVTRACRRDNYEERGGSGHGAFSHPAWRQ